MAVIRLNKKRILKLTILVLMLYCLIINSKISIKKHAQKIVDFEENELLILNYDHEETIDFKKLGDKIRLVSNNYKNLLDWIDENGSDETVHLRAQELDDHMFKWIQPRFKSIVEMRSSFEGNGIVICVGNHQTNMAVANIKMIRQVFNSNIPVEVFYMGEGDLSLENRNRLESIPFTRTVDLFTIFNNNIMKIGGWAIKPFAMLASSFQNVCIHFI
jgi:hypothetical protein